MYLDISFTLVRHEVAMRLAWRSADVICRAHRGDDHPAGDFAFA